MGSEYDLYIKYCNEMPLDMCFIWRVYSGNTAYIATVLFFWIIILDLCSKPKHHKVPQKSFPQMFSSKRIDDERYKAMTWNCNVYFCDLTLK